MIIYNLVIESAIHLSYNLREVFLFGYVDWIILYNSVYFSLHRIRFCLAIAVEKLGFSQQHQSRTAVSKCKRGQSCKCKKHKKVPQRGKKVSFDDFTMRTLKKSLCEDEMLDWTVVRMNQVIVFLDGPRTPKKAKNTLTRQIETKLWNRKIGNTTNARSRQSRWSISSPDEATKRRSISSPDETIKWRSISSLDETTKFQRKLSRRQELRAIGTCNKRTINAPILWNYIKRVYDVTISK